MYDHEFPLRQSFTESTIIEHREEIRDIKLREYALDQSYTMHGQHGRGHKHYPFEHGLLYSLEVSYNDNVRQGSSGLDWMLLESDRQLLEPLTESYYSEDSLAPYLPPLFGLIPEIAKRSSVAGLHSLRLTIITLPHDSITHEPGQLFHYALRLRDFEHLLRAIRNRVKDDFHVQEFTLCALADLNKDLPEPTRSTLTDIRNVSSVATEPWESARTLGNFMKQMEANLQLLLPDDSYDTNVQHAGSFNVKLTNLPKEISNDYLSERKRRRLEWNPPRLEALAIGLRRRFDAAADRIQASLREDVTLASTQDLHFVRYILTSSLAFAYDAVSDYLCPLKQAYGDNIEMVEVVALTAALLSVVNQRLDIQRDAELAKKDPDLYKKDAELYRKHAGRWTGADIIKDKSVLAQVDIWLGYLESARNHLSPVIEDLFEDIFKAIGIHPKVANHKTAWEQLPKHRTWDLIHDLSRSLEHQKPEQDQKYDESYHQELKFMIFLQSCMARGSEDSQYSPHLNKPRAEWEICIMQSTLTEVLSNKEVEYKRDWKHAVLNNEIEFYNDVGKAYL